MLSPSKLLLAVALLLTASFSFAQPVNDDCAGAVLLSVGANTTCDNTVPGTTVLAGYSGVDYCGMPYRDVWYKFEATANAHTLSISNANDTIGNSAVYFLVEVFSGDCSGLSHSFCSDWYYWNGNVSFGDLTPGDTYFIRVISPYSQAFNFDICLSTPPVPPANDACTGAVTIDVDPDAACDAPLPGNTTGATGSPVPVCNECVYADDDLWYKFTATQANHIVALTNIRFANDPNSFAFGIAYIFSGNCGNFTPVRGFGFYGDGSDVVTNLTPGQTYYIRVYSSYVDIPITFDLCVTSPPPPANDECAGAEIALASTDLYCGTPFYGSTYLSTPSGTDCSGGTANDVWFQFSATSQSQRIELYPATGIDQFGFEVYEGSCGTQNSLACASGNDSYILLYGLTVGATYYLRIFSPPNNTYYFTGCILAMPPPPANDECAAAISMSVNPDAGCNVQITGSTLGATSSAQNCAGNTTTHDVWYSFVATGDIHRLEVNPNITIFGGVLQFGYEVFSGDCNNLTSLVCKSFPNDYGPAILNGLTPGATYYVRAYSEYGSAHEFSICVQTVPPPPANVSCADAQEIIPAAGIDCAGVTAGTTAGLDTVDAGYCFYGMDVWYQFTATTNTHIVRVSDVQYLYGNSGNYYVEIYGGADCDNLSILQCQGYASNFYLNNLTLGQTYYIRWVSESFSAHQFNICIGSVPPPANDLCANTILLPVDDDMVCDNATPGTTAGSSHLPVQDACFNNNDVWYSFTATQAAHQIHLSEVVDIVNGYGQYFLAELFTGDCNSLSSVYCWNSFNYYDAFIVAGDLTPGQTYHIRIANPYEVAVNFNICVLTPPPPPANDACINAVPLSVEPGNACTAATAGTTLYATPSPGLESVCCGGGDVWYSFVAAQANQNIWLSNIVDASYGYQGYAFVQVYASACSNYTLLASETAFGGNPLYVTQLTPGETYHIRVYPFYNSQAINFDICVTAPPPPVNDECADALPLPVSENLDCSITLNASTTGATQSQAACNGNASNDIWYQFTATSVTYRFDMNVNNGSYNEWGYEVFAGDCDNLTSLQCYEPSYSTTFTLEGLTIGDTYYLRLFSAQNRIHDLFVCTRPLPPPPANDECAGAIAVTVDSDMTCDAPTQGTTLSATQSQSSCYGYPSNDVWYTFTATGVSHLLELIPTASYFNGSSFDLGFEVIGGDCDNQSDVLCQDYLYQNGFVVQNLTPGASYFVRVYSKYEYAHDFTLCVMTLPPPPANDQCEQATPVLPNEDLTCDNIFPGTTLGSTPGLHSNVPDVWFSFTATSNSHLFDLLNINTILGYPGNIGLEVYQGSDCNALMFLTNFQPGNFPGLINYLQPGETYRIRVYPLDPNGAYTFDLCIKTLPPSPPNETCAGAFELTPNTGTECDIVAEGTTAGAVTVDYYTCAYGNDVWYQFTATSPNHQVQASNIATVLGYGNLSVAVLQSEDCINFNTLACVYYDQTIYLSGLITGETYYVRVAGEYNSMHTYTLCIKTVPPPPNDLCANAASLVIDEDQYCDNAVSGTAAGAGPSGFSACSYDANDVWYSFTATQTAHTIYFSNITDAQFGYASYFGVEIFAGTCSDLQNVSCRHNLYLNDFYTLGELTPGQTYFIRFMTYNPNGVNFDICVGTPPPPPANDACVNAVDLPVSAGETCETLTQGSTENATPSPLTPYYGYGAQNNDVWFSFTATQANHGIEFSNIYNPGSFLIAEVYSGECGALTTIIQQYLPYNGAEFLLTNLTPGAVYYVRVFEYYNQATTFDLCVTSLPVPSNDECAGAITLPVDPDLQCDSPTPGSTYGATQSFSNCYGAAANDVWFQFVATGVSHRLDVASTGSTNGSGYFGIEVYEGNCETLITILPCSQNYYGYLQTIQGLTPGNTYYIRVSTDPGYFADFNLCILTLPPPPANDECAGATVIEANADYNCDLTYNGTTLGATQSATSCYGGATHDVWFQFTATGVTHVFDLDETGDPFGNNYFMGMEIYAGGDCQSLTSLRCTEDYYGDPVTLSNLDVGATYFVRVFSQYNSAFDFSLCIRTLPPPPANDACANAIAVQPNPGMECIDVVAGSTAGLLEYNNYNGCSSGVDMWYQFTATGNAHLIKLEDIVNVYGYVYLSLELYTSSCEALNLLACSYGGSEIYWPNFVPGENYLIRVVGAANSATNFNLCLLTVLPPPNNECADAVSLPVSPGVACETTVAGTIQGANAAEQTGGCYLNHDVWYSFVATSDAHNIRISNIQPNNGYYELLYEVLDGTCGAWTNLGCYSAFESPTITNLVPGNTYYVRVGSLYPYSTSFDICVTTPLPDLYAYNISPYTNGCGSTNNETVQVTFINLGNAIIPAGAAEFTLAVSGSNTGTYGPLTNPEPIYPGYWTYLYFTGVDLSNPGQSELIATGTVAGDYNPDNNMVGINIEILTLDTFYYDSDGDGYGNPEIAVVNCFQYEGVVTNSDDCDDYNYYINPAATEFCNGYDDDCDGLTDGDDPGVVDTIQPGITCPPDTMLVNDPGLCSAVVSYYDVTAWDDCSYTVTQTAGIEPGGAFPVGTTVNTYQVADVANNTASCSFTVEVQKTGDPDLLYAYTVIGFKEVLMKKNTVQSGGIGVVNANKKAILQLNTMVTASNTFVKAPVLQLQSGSQNTTYYQGQVATDLLPAFQPNNNPGNNNVTIANNSAPVVLNLNNYGKITVGNNVTVTFSGHAVVRIKELQIGNDATVLFAQGTEVLIDKKMDIGKNTDINPGGGQAVQFFVEGNVTVDKGVDVTANIYTEKNLYVLKATAANPTLLTGLFIADKVDAQEHVFWNWDGSYCPLESGSRTLADGERTVQGQPEPNIIPGRLTLFPNPASEAVQVAFDWETSGEARVQLFDATGRLARDEKFVVTEGSNQYRLDLAGLPEGVYSVQVTDGERRAVEKLVIVK